MTPVQTEVRVLRAGEEGFISAGIKELNHAQVGDTIALANKWEGLEMLAGYSPAKPMVYCGLYPSDSDDYAKLRDAITKLKLNDAALTYTAETSSALGYGFRCGFLGLLHMDIVQVTHLIMVIMIEKCSLIPPVLTYDTHQNARRIHPRERICRSVLNVSTRWT